MIYEHNRYHNYKINEEDLMSIEHSEGVIYNDEEFDELIKNYYGDDLEKIKMVVDMTPSKVRKLIKKMNSQNNSQKKFIMVWTSFRGTYEKKITLYGHLYMYKEISEIKNIKCGICCEQWIIKL